MRMTGGSRPRPPGLVTVLALLGALCAAAAASAEDRYGAATVVGDGELAGLRGGTAVDSFNDTTTVSSTNGSTQSIGTGTLIANDIVGGGVAFSGQALQNVQGIVTQSFATAPFAQAVAQTSISINGM